MEKMSKTETVAYVIVVHLLNCVQLFVTPWTATCQASLSFTISWNLLRFMSTESVMSSNHLILCCRLLLLPSVFPSVSVYSSESTFHVRWPENLSFSISPSNEYSGSISFRIDWFDLAVQQNFVGSSEPLRFWGLAFFMVPLSHPYITTGKTSFDYMDLCHQSDASGFLICCPGLS